MNLLLQFLCTFHFDRESKLDCIFTDEKTVSLLSSPTQKVKHKKRLSKDLNGTSTPKKNFDRPDPLRLLDLVGGPSFDEGPVAFTSCLCMDELDEF